METFNKKPLLSIVIPLKDPILSFFKDAIFSILAQSYTNLEVIIVNDGTSNEIISVLNDFISGLNDNRFHIINANLTNHSGPSVARNKGIETASGEIIIFLDADDILLPWYCQDVANIFTSDNKCLIVGTPPFFYFPARKEDKIFLPLNCHNLLNFIEKVVFSSFRYFKILDNEDKELLSLIAKRVRPKLIFFTTPRLSCKRETFNLVKYDSNFSAIEDTEFCLNILNTPDVINNAQINFNFSYLYRIYSLKKRHTRKVNLNFKHLTKIVKKYSEEGTVANEVLKEWRKKHDDWRFCTHISNFLEDKSLSRYLKNTFFSLSNRKEKIRSLRALVNTIFMHKFLKEKLGLDFRAYEIPGKYSINKTNETKERLVQYIDNCKDEKVRFYSTKTFESVFTPSKQLS